MGTRGVGWNGRRTKSNFNSGGELCPGTEVCEHFSNFVSNFPRIIALAAIVLFFCTFINDDTLRALLFNVLFEKSLWQRMLTM